jgi:hypothetical protein
MPGPHDHHRDKGVIIQPTESPRVNAASADELHALKEALAVAEAALTEQRRAYATREQEVTEQQQQLKRERDVTEQQQQREQELDARERALAEKESRPAKKG